MTHPTDKKRTAEYELRFHYGAAKHIIDGLRNNTEVKFLSDADKIYTVLKRIELAQIKLLDISETLLCHKTYELIREQADIVDALLGCVSKDLYDYFVRLALDFAENHYDERGYEIVRKQEN